MKGSAPSPKSTPKIQFPGREHLIDVDNIREDFPILKENFQGQPLCYLDNAASTQKPQCVVDRLKTFYEHENANIHRGVYELSQRSTQAYETAREKVQHFIHARDSREIIFVRGTTEAINLVATSYGRSHLKPGDEVLISVMEHHSNLVPWQLLCKEKNARLQVVPINPQGELELESFKKLLNSKTRLVALGHVSNALGTINPIKTLIDLAHQQGAVVLIDGAQAVPHLPVNVQELDCDFYAFSGHKLYGPTGIGVLYGKWNLLESMPPYQSGGEMIQSVTLQETTFHQPPQRFEAGTCHIAGAIGMGAAIDYIQQVGLDQIRIHEEQLLRYCTEQLETISQLQVIGTSEKKTGVVSFVIEEIHPHDIGTILDQQAIAVRTGHHCAQPLMNWYGVSATARASFALYNTIDEIDRLVQGLHEVRKVFSHVANSRTLR